MLRYVPLMLPLAVPAFAQQSQTTPPMAPSEAYQYALAPFNEARQQPNDLTDADKLALGISISRAAQACQAIPLTALPTADEELLAMAKLCILGQQYDPARQALVSYLAQPSAKDRELAILLLTRAFLGLQSIGSAEGQTESLLSEFPYDANIHYAIDQVVDAAQASGDGGDDIVRRLNEQQLPLTLKALRENGSLTTSDKSAVVPAKRLFIDALRCASQYRTDGRQNDAEVLVSELAAIASNTKDAQGTQLPVMQAALRRYGMIGADMPRKSLHAKSLAANGALLPQSILLQGKTTILLPISLLAPTSADVIQKISAAFSKHATMAIYAITSFSVNTGGEDKPDAQTLSMLRAFKLSLPGSVPLLIVANDFLDSLGIDGYPSGVVIDKEGTVRFVDSVATAGTLRLFKQAAKR